MKLLLTSNGLSNDSIAEAFEGLIGKKPKDSRVAFIPTAANPVRGNKNWLIDDLYRIKDRGYYVDVIELTAQKPNEISGILEDFDAIFVGGGNTFYLSYWIQKTGLSALLPELLKTKVYAGISAGSIVTGGSLLPSKAIKDGYIDEHYYEQSLDDQGSDKPLNLVDIIIRPHFNSPTFPMVSNDNLSKIAPKLSYPLYAIDDMSAIQVIDGDIKIITEGEFVIYDK